MAAIACSACVFILNRFTVRFSFILKSLTAAAADAIHIALRLCSRVWDFPVVSRDAKNLETMIVMAYNFKLKGTPFYKPNQLSLSPSGETKPLTTSDAFIYFFCNVEKENIIGSFTLWTSG